jgi:toxin ParE1/3/4
MIALNKLPLAESDLIDIWLHGCKTWGIVQADSYLDDLENTLISLTENPERHALKKQFKPPVRICPYVSHIIVYIIENDALNIIRVLHKSMDIKHRL